MEQAVEISSPSQIGRALKKGFWQNQKPITRFQKLEGEEFSNHSLICCFEGKTGSAETAAHIILGGLLRR